MTADHSLEDRVPTGSFEDPSQPPPEGSREFLLKSWDSIRDRGISPRFQSALDSDEGRRVEFLRGAGELRLFGPRALKGRSLVPQNLRVADVVNAGNEFTAVSKPRRSSKTTSLLALALGRCMEREDYRVGYTMATTALKARDRFSQDIVTPLMSLYPDAKDSPWTIFRGGGRESVIFRETGSRFQILAPKGESFRSDAWDLIIVDEGGEATPEASEDIIAGALATMDTRPDAQIIVAGTAAKYRRGNLLWDQLEEGRKGKGGILEFAADQSTTAEDIETWDQAAALLVETHPGVGTLTTLDRLRSRHEKLKPSAFLAEYLGVFGEVGVTAFIEPAKWLACRAEGDLPEPPERFTMGLAVHQDSTVATIAAAWRDEDDHACIVILWNGPVRQLQSKALMLARKYKAGIAHDTRGAATDSEVLKLNKAKPKPRMLGQNWANVSNAASRMTKEINSANLRHWGQPDLDHSASIVTKRADANTKRWAFGRADVEDDITPFEAASIALFSYDETPPRPSFLSVMES